MGGEDNLCPELLRAVEGVKYIADVTRREEESNKVGGRHYIKENFVCFLL